MPHDRVILLAMAACILFSDRPAASAEDRPVSFNRDIRPILSDNCVFCHGPDPSDRKGKLRLDLPDGLLDDRGGYRILDTDAPDESELLFRITSDDDLDRMPPPESGKELTADEVDLLRRWIAEGAEFPPHWSFETPTRPEVPDVRDTSWPINAIDRFLLSRIEAEGLRPAPEADPETLARRLSLDLTGLPVRPGESAIDDRPGAFDRLVDRLMDSPRFGERMAISWLDLVRYADTVGYHGDQEHHASPYRDYVISSINDNLPFDRFTREQLAGDLLPDATIDQQVASGYNRLLQTTHEGGAQDGEYLAKYAADRVRNVSSVWLGATMGCAECHDHKYDPYSQREFYRFAAFFADLDQRGAYPGPDATPTVRAPEIDVLDPMDRLAMVEVEDALESLGDEEHDRRTELEARRTNIASRTRRSMVSVSVEPRPTRVLARGDWMDRTGDVVEPGVPAVLPALEIGGGRASRLDLANWLTRPNHPLTARVVVNRLWDQFFGRGLFRSLDDTGLQGELPSNPELLDWLALELIESGWDVKHVVRLITTSRAYRQSSLVDSEVRAIDPENHLFARQGRFRLPAEVIRDQSLFVSDLIVERLGGAPVRPYQPEGYYAHLNFPKRTYVPHADSNQYRRGVYVHWQRQFLQPMLRAFDAPSREECTAKRPSSNTPIGALTLLNDPSAIEAARGFAARVLLDSGVSDENDRLKLACRIALGRDANAREVGVLRRLLDESRVEFAEDPDAVSSFLTLGLAPVPEGLDRIELASWSAVARALLNLHETITRY